jgi:hypothetical protein
MTTQASDQLLYRGDRYAMLATPLEDYFQQVGTRPDFKLTSTGNWRGYIGEWQVEDGKLYLKDLLQMGLRNSGFALMRNRVRVNQLDIGWMLSDHEKTIQLQESGDPDWQAKAEAGLPFGRLLDPAEVAKAVLWLASDDSGMMTGSVVHFDQSVWGGYDGQAPAPAQLLA